MTAQPYSPTIVLIVFAWIGTFVFLVADYFTSKRWERRPLPTLIAIVAVSSLAIVACRTMGAP